MSSPSNLAFRSPFLRKMVKGTRKAKRNTNNIYISPTTEVPELNLSYVGNRNESVRNNLNKAIMNVALTRNKPLTNRQKEARIAVARKMARGEPVEFWEKAAAGMVTVPKPTGPRPVKGGKKTRRNRKQ